MLLPPLLFESAFAIDWHIFYKVSKYALFLALPGLIIATVLTGLTYAGLYGWSWEACMLTGGILSATDPVAVVALLISTDMVVVAAVLVNTYSLVLLLFLLLQNQLLLVVVVKHGYIISQLTFLVQYITQEEVNQQHLMVK